MDHLGEVVPPGVIPQQGEVGQVRAVGQGAGAEIEQPGGDDRTPPPQLGNVGQVEVVLIMLGLLQGAWLGLLAVCVLGSLPLFWLCGYLVQKYMRED